MLTKQSLLHFLLLIGQVMKQSVSKLFFKNKVLFKLHIKPAQNLSSLHFCHSSCHLSFVSLPPCTHAFTSHSSISAVPSPCCRTVNHLLLHWLLNLSPHYFYPSFINLPSSSGWSALVKLKYLLWLEWKIWVVPRLEENKCCFKQKTWG